MLLSLFSAINKNYTDLRQPGNALFCMNTILTMAEHTAQSKLKLQRNVGIINELERINKNVCDRSFTAVSFEVKQ
ncbi:hypothetical protein T03_15829 [Trichinella britovi]|uniref:Uncharacterized protein n=1 Tax=Trichinella britovi TaxID=45882 RepID=A0A0V1CEQ3_TRIBR|nr:hypothetical protein T03_15829 [Trichinella britovi]